MTARVVFAAAAQIQADTIDEWWRENRPAAPELFLDELMASTRLVASAPSIGKPYPCTTVPGVRRLLLRRSRYHIYYVTQGTTVLAAAIWGAQRGSGPDLDSLG